MGSFRPIVGSLHLHRQYNFTEPLVETALKSLRHSCRSELTRQGISLEPCSSTQLCSKRRHVLVCVPSLHVAMQTGPSHDPVSWISGVWPLRILISSCLGFWRFIVCAISTISMRPSASRCRPLSTSSTHFANFS